MVSFFYTKYWLDSNTKTCQIQCQIQWPRRNSFDRNIEGTKCIIRRGIVQKWFINVFLICLLLYGANWGKPPKLWEFASPLPCPDGTPTDKTLNLVLVFLKCLRTSKIIEFNFVSTNMIMTNAKVYLLHQYRLQPEKLSEKRSNQSIFKEQNCSDCSLLCQGEIKILINV